MIVIAILIQWGAIRVAVSALHIDSKGNQPLHLAAIWVMLSSAVFAAKVFLPHRVSSEIVVGLLATLLMILLAKAVFKLVLSRAVIFWLLAGLIGTLFAVPVALGIRTFVVKPFSIPSGAMEPAIMKGDSILVSRLAYTLHSPQRWDIAVFRYPGDRRRPFLKRIVGLPGETIELRDGNVLINGREAQRLAFLESIHWSNQGQYGQAGQQVKVPANSYYVLGDTSETSHDSRFWGFVSKGDLIGKAFYIFAPRERMGEVK